VAIQQTQNKSEVAGEDTGKLIPQSDHKLASPTPQPAGQGLVTQSIRFPNGRQAELVTAPDGTEAETILAALTLKPAEVLFLIIGGSNDRGEDYLSQPLTSPKKTKRKANRSAPSLEALHQSLGTDSDEPDRIPREAYLAQLFSRGIARTAVNVKAVILDGGRQSGIMAMMGQGVADRGYQSALIGVAPAHRVTYPGGPVPESEAKSELLDSHHSHFVLTEGAQWGDETDLMVQLAAKLAKGKPIITILVNGGSVAKKQALYSVRQGWPVVVVKGSGHLADEIAELWQNRPDFIPDPGLAEIIADGKLHFLQLKDSIDTFAWLVEQLLRQHQVAVAAPRPAELTLQQIRFTNKRQAMLVTTSAETDINEIVRTMGLEQPNAVLWLLGGSTELNEALLTFNNVFSVMASVKNGDNKALPVSANQSGRQSGVSKEMMNSIYDLLIDADEDGTVPTVHTLSVDTLARLMQLFRLGIGPAAAEKGAIIIDGGRQTGVMAMLGQAAANQPRPAPLIGVAPVGKVTYPGGPAPGSLRGGEPLDPHHTHFVLTEGDQWGDETKTMANLAAALVRQAPETPLKTNGKPTAPKDRLVVTVLVNGDTLAKKQLVHSVQQGWPILVIKGSGNLADEIAQLRQSKPAFIPDPDLAEIISQGKLHILELERAPTEFKLRFEQLLNEQLLRHHQTDVTSIEQAWQTFATYDAAAKRQQNVFRRMQFWILTLGVLGTFLALTKQTLENLPAVQTAIPYYAEFDGALYYTILFIPILITMLAAAANEFSAGKKWILLRASAESIKKEIYRYRAKAEIYSDRETRQLSREVRLAMRINTISDNLIKGETKLAALESYKGSVPPPYGAHPNDDGLSFFTPDRYLPLRLVDQYNYYKSRTVRLERQLHQLQWLIYIIGAAGTLLVALGLELWIALTTALVTAFTTYLEYQQVESRLIRYNRTALNLHQIMMWWEALSIEEQADPRNIDKLVGKTEATIHSEHAAWVQEMQDVLDELNAQQSQDGKRPGERKQEKEEEVTPEDVSDLLDLFEEEQENLAQAEATPAKATEETANRPEPAAQARPEAAGAEAKGSAAADEKK
jgi:hypothetical protein